MATHPVVIRNGISDYVVDKIDIGSTDATGDLVFLTAGDVEVATLAMTNPAFGAAASGVATAATITNDPSATGGTIAKFKIQDRDNTTVVEGSCSLIGGGGEMELTSLVIVAAEEVSISSLTYTAPS